jgi:hypothetical protein
MNVSAAASNWPKHANLTNASSVKVAIQLTKVAIQEFNLLFQVQRAAEGAEEADNYGFTFEGGYDDEDHDEGDGNDEGEGMDEQQATATRSGGRWRGLYGYDRFVDLQRMRRLLLQVQTGPLATALARLKSHQNHTPAVVDEGVVLRRMCSPTGGVQHWPAGTKSECSRV